MTSDSSSQAATCPPACLPHTMEASNAVTFNLERQAEKL